MLDQPVVGIDGAFYFADGKEIRFLVLPDGTIRQASGEIDLTGVELRRLAATRRLVSGLRDALLDAGLGDVETGPLREVAEPESADAMAWHLLHDHALSAAAILDWLLVRSESVHRRGDATHPHNTVAVFLEQLHHCEHEDSGKEFGHTHGGEQR